MSRLAALRFSVNSFHSSNLFRRFWRLHSLVLAGRYFRAPCLGASYYFTLSEIAVFFYLVIEFSLTKLILLINNTFSHICFYSVFKVLFTSQRKYVSAC